MASETVAGAAAVAEVQPQLMALREEVGAVLRGKPEVIRLALVTVLAGGHLLLEDVPGVGKTTLALALARGLGLSFKRVQFTSDLLPSDIVGVSVYSPKTGEFSFRPGPVFAGLVLADEINRSTPRTQSALLEAMSEGRVSVDDVTHTLPSPFHVIATQNPLEHHGTYPLPESQLDRFLMRLSIGYPDPQIERDLLLRRGSSDPLEDITARFSRDSLQTAQQRCYEVELEESVATYLMDIVEATRRDERVRIGVSTRGALAFARAVRALALLEGRSFCIPDDVRELAVPVLAHRLSLVAGATGTQRELQEMVAEEIVSQIQTPT